MNSMYALVSTIWFSIRSCLTYFNRLDNTQTRFRESKVSNHPAVCQPKTPFAKCKSLSTRLFLWRDIFF